MTQPFATVVDIARDIASGNTSAVEVLEHHLARINEREHDIHAFNLVTTEQARATAQQVDADIKAGKKLGPLAGVPIALKDNMCTRGIETTCSSKILEGWKPPYDATVVTRLQQAGAVMVGKTNLDEFAMGSSTENSAFGPTKNPLDTTRVPGGSSGGSAAAVAAGFAAASLGSDTGGSIRQPASLCGLVGVKPTYGLVSRQGIVAFASSLDQVGPFTHTVADAALMMEVIGGHDPLDSTSLPQPMPSLTSVLGQGVTGLRIGRLADMPDGCEPEVLARMDAAYAALQAAGATIVDISLPSLSYCLTAYYLVAPAEASSNLARYDGVRYGMRVETADLHSMYGATRAAGFGAEVKRRIMLGTYALSAGYFDAYYGKALKVRRLIANDFAAAYEKCDVILTPTSPTVAFPLGDKTSDPLTMYLCDIFTIPTNLAGHAAMSVPFGTGAHNMPVGVQVLAPALGEPTMFRVAAELERAS
ncbi:MAG: Asp-tRNA(Asn)/Glu-tRNA(Gln) amidotransferase subunit GatA [Actinobacteria bacterium]|jgi:aspartyl-tRNA(Asn)/glutamyl-tRNA(Gln) amidotransferase subunit A|nr:MAG: glutamyl-tRNA amidotransferase [Acidimicrobium sp. BACL17 MAG-120823-bin42]MDA0192491.1 Asp-tRNA(Asn)/Glu-tRNA(Gln) amidotransferase subunit GatA [Actinomycetota bacterium]MDA2951654.1 Asp-tRNA(Asn)/Glu-tRNA(Gln) amidotransferase subunit GatA [Actinomycetota bacterium]MDA2998506.1 Asp-tRNA(Asn)/Glu-tRNA(Gln) amidotransferase subunit GatA [Actinomycetota bacterium]